MRWVTATVASAPHLVLLDKHGVVHRREYIAVHDRVTISTGHLAELIGAYFGDGARWDIAIDYLREDKPLSTAGPLGLLEEFDEPLLVMNGDGSRRWTAMLSSRKARGSRR